MRAQIRLFMGLLAVLIAEVCAAQSPVEIPPPPIQFDPWKKVSESETEEEFALTFPSAVATPFPENSRVPVKALLPLGAQRPVPVVVILHYWGATDQRVERALAAELNRNGVAAVLMALPYHLERTPAGARSGSLAIEPDPERIVATTIQSVLDVRRTVDWIATRPEFDSGRIGVAGTSLGALVASLVYALEPRISVANFMLGGADLAHILWNGSRVVGEREALRSKGFSEAALRENLRSIEPLEFLSRRTSGRAFVVGARYDTVIPPLATQKLIDALDGPEVLMLDTGHYGGFFVQRKLLRTVGEFFGSVFAGREWSAPDRLGAPTLRIGVDLNVRQGLQVVGGIDLWHSRPPDRAFASLLLSPRGPQLFLGREIGRGIAVGATGLKDGFTFGLFWSVIL